MRIANTQLQADRRNEILDAARRCFVRSGFHAASMQEICTEAGMSPGNLYRYFESKEALIAGIAARDQAEVSAEFAAVDLSQGLFKVLEGLAHHHFSERPDEQVLMCTEVMAQARRHPEIGTIIQNFDEDVRRWLRELFEAGKKRGDIPADVELEPVITMLMLIADGMWWKRALHKDFDSKAVLPLFMDIIRHMLRAKPKAVGGIDSTSGHSGARATRANPESRNNSGAALDSGSAPDGASRNDNNAEESGR